MIFFIIDKKTRDIVNGSDKTDYSAVRNHNLGSAYPHYGEVLLVSWNEVYPLAQGSEPLKELRNAVFKAALEDPVCMDLRVQSQRLFGLDPILENFPAGSLSRQSVEKIVKDIFFDWAHPMIGNIANSPHVRPATSRAHFHQNWSDCNFLDLETKSRIDSLSSALGKITRSARDQVRICYNIVELARAIMGEITSYVPRRMERLLALRLCSSEKLHTAQVEMIRLFLKRHGPALKSDVQKHGGKVDCWSRFEYCKYYLPPSVSGLKGEALWKLVRKLIIEAGAGESELDLIDEVAGQKKGGAASNQGVDELIQESVEIWKKLPRQIRCAILMNDFRKACAINDLKNPEKSSFELIYTQSGNATNNYRLVNAPGTSHVPILKQQDRLGWKLAWSWNRDERHAATITYRHFLCPLWAGPSGHAGGGIAWWMQRLENEFPVHGARTVATGLFALWRLYYDKRISGFHTLAETFEATCNELVVGSEKRQVFPRGIRTKLEETDDAYDLVGQSVWKSLRVASPDLESVDAIALFERLRQSCYEPSSRDHNERLARLEALINDQSQRLQKSGFSVIQWTAELSERKGMKAQKFDPMMGVLRVGFLIPDNVRRVIANYAPSSGSARTHNLKEGDKLPSVDLMAAEHFKPFEEPAHAYTDLLYFSETKVEKPVEIETRQALAEALSETALIKYLSGDYVPPDRMVELDARTATWKGGRKLDDDNNVSAEDQGQRPGFVPMVDEEQEEDTYKTKLAKANSFIGKIVSPRLLRSLDPPGVIVFSYDEERGEYRANEGDKFVRVSMHDAVETIVHEVGHYLEDHSLTPLWNDVVFLREHRHRKCSDNRMAGGIPVDQESVDDDGKLGARFKGDYPATGLYTPKAYSHGATEITSMTLQFLANKDTLQKLIRDDPQQAAVVLRRLTPDDPELQALFEKYKDYLPGLHSDE